MSESFWGRSEIDDVVEERERQIAQYLRRAWGRPAGLRDQAEREMGRFIAFDHHLWQTYGNRLGIPSRDWRDVCPPERRIRTIRWPKSPSQDRRP